MKTVAGLLYKYAIPRGHAEKNLAEYLKVNDNTPTKEKMAFTNSELLPIAADIHLPR